MQMYCTLNLLDLRIALGVLTLLLHCTCLCYSTTALLLYATVHDAVHCFPPLIPPPSIPPPQPTLSIPCLWLH